MQEIKKQRQTEQMKNFTHSETHPFRGNIPRKKKLNKQNHGAQ